MDTSPSLALTAEQFVTQSAQKMINIDPQRRELTQAAYTVDYGGKQFSRADYKQSLKNGGAMYLGYVYTKFRGYLIGGTLIASSPKPGMNLPMCCRRSHFATTHRILPACQERTMVYSRELHLASLDQ